AGLDPDYFLLNGNLGYRFTDCLSVSVQVMNILDEQYQNILGAPMPGRWIIGSLGVRF
ncbi:MAG: TonB-dependent receptor, partial [Flavobacteriales bacterium]|nr:TonB-dependent receptor [Flavobacteriales bacterium]